MLKEISNLVKSNKKWIILFICIIILLIIIENVFSNEILDFDNYIYKKISLIRTQNITNIFIIITNIASASVLIIITLITLIFFKDKKIGTAITINLLIIVSLNIALKNIIQRPRPIGFRLIEESGYSFPSGHSMVSMAFYGLIIYFIYNSIKNKKLKIILISLLAVLILLIGISRIYLGVHYTSDVLAGFIISVAYLIIYETTIIKLLRIKK